MPDATLYFRVKIIQRLSEIYMNGNIASIPGLIVDKGGLMCAYYTDIDDNSDSMVLYMVRRLSSVP